MRNKLLNFRIDGNDVGKYEDSSSFLYGLIGS